MKRLFSISVCLFALLEIGTSLTCLQCEGISHPRHCRFVADCFEGDVCAVETVKNSFGQHMYKVGCVPPRQCSNSSLNSDTCHECCNSNLCNAQGCGESGYPTERGPICYHCPAPVDVNMCNTIEFCEAGEVCHYMEREEFGDVVYTGKCTSKYMCTASVFLGNVVVGRDVVYETSQQTESSDNTFTGIRSLKDTTCEGCCGYDLCNKGCNITNTDSCRSSPCVHGQCKDTTEGFSCLCPAGFNGVRCEIVVDSCRSSPCVHGQCNSTSEGFTCLCPAGVTGVRCEIVRPTDCYDIQHMGLGTRDGIYNIRLWHTNRTIQVLCDLTTDGGGWTIFQNRFDGSVDFYRNFINYTSGFGNPTGEFWLGLDIIHEMTTQRLTELRIDLTAASGNKGYEVFKSFSISEGPGYVLHNLPGTGTIEHSSSVLTYHTGQSFSTYDHDNDSDSRNCAIEFHGGWWYNVCFIYNLNGKYLLPGTEDVTSMNVWGFIGNYNYASLRSSRMMFRLQH